jgi:hypothetical protein
VELDALQMTVVVESLHSAAVVVVEGEEDGVAVVVVVLVLWEQYGPVEFVGQVHVQEQSVSTW